jgi:hypothetical protein
MNRSLPSITASLTAFTICGCLTTKAQADPQPDTKSTSQATPAAFPVTKQATPLKFRAQGKPIKFYVGWNPVIKFPSDIISVTYANGDIALPRAAGPRMMHIEGKKLGETEIAIWMKNQPQTPFLMRVKVVKTITTPTDGRILASSPGPYQKPFPIKEVEQLPTTTVPVENIELGTGRDRLLTFKSDILEVNTSSGSTLGAFAVNGRTLVVIGQATGNAELLVRTRRSDTDTAGAINRYTVTVVHAEPTPMALRDKRIKSLEEDLRKRDERIRELEKQLAEEVR